MSDLQKNNIKTIKYLGYVPKVFEIRVLPYEPKQTNRPLVFEVLITDQLSLPQKCHVLILRFKIYEDDEKNNELGEIEIRHAFYIEDIESYFTKSDSGVYMSEKVYLAQMLGIAMSTSRGIIMTKMEGMFHVPPILPIVNPIEMVEGYLNEKTIPN